MLQRLRFKEKSQIDLSEFINSNYGEEYVIPDKLYLVCEEMFAQADKLMREDRLPEAIEMLLEILQRNPQYGKAYNHFGWIYDNKYRNSIKAEECYKKAMKYAPEYTATYLNYSYLLSTCQRFYELKAHLDIALTIPGIPQESIFIDYAIMYETQQNLEAAINYYLKAAMITLGSDKLALYKESINRCQMKLELKNSLSALG